MEEREMKRGGKRHKMRADARASGRQSGNVAFKSFRFSGLTGGLYASANLFDQPQGTLPRISNLVYTRRGGLQTVDGSRVIVKPNRDTNPGPYDPIASLQQYNPAGVPGIVPHLLVSRSRKTTSPT